MKMLEFQKTRFMISAKCSSMGGFALVCALCLGVQVGCSSESEPDRVQEELSDVAERVSAESGMTGQPPQIQSLQLTPLRPQPGELVQALVEVKKQDETALDLDFSWSIDGDRVRARSDAVRFRLLAKEIGSRSGLRSLIRTV